MKFIMLDREEEEYIPPKYKGFLFPRIIEESRWEKRWVKELVNASCILSFCEAYGGSYLRLATGQSWVGMQVKQTTGEVMKLLE